ncbi:septation protein SepH [Actinophytocola sp.]|uniref:septation protein SepH n=1 Tax=Actinophytocola sp. TaxID=1872138 RepID=UPI003D6A0E98
MRALRVVGLGEDGKIVICEDPARGERFQIPADERLRAAARGDITRLGQIAIELESQMRPREIQTRIRAGESVEQVASAAGVPANRVERFAYPVLLERSRTAELAQRAHPVREDGPDVQELGEVVAQAFTARGQDYSVATWDSWKGEDGKWVVQLTWTAGRSHNRAHWSFHPGAHGGTVSPLDDLAVDLLDPNPNRQLRTVRPVTELAAQAERPERVVAPVESPVEQEHRQAVGEVSRRSAGEPEPRSEQDFVQDFELTDEADDPPAEEPPAPEPPAAPPAQPATSTTAPPRRPAATRTSRKPATPTPQPAATPRQPAAEAAPDAEPRTAQPRQPAAPTAPAAPPAAPPAAQPEPAPEPAAAKEEPKPAPRRGKGKKSRPTVPSWEDVLLGTRSNR